MSVLEVPDGRHVHRVLLVPREEFLTRRWRYASGEHVTFLAPTGGGKTTLAYQLLQQSASPDRPVIGLVMKPRDSTVTAWTRELQFRRTRDWPPLSRTVGIRPAGYTLWPKHSFDPDKDDVTLRKAFRAAILDSYKKGNRIIFGDEVWGLCAELGLERELIALWTRGRSMGAGLWSATQKPTHIPLQAYSQAAHLFLAHDPDANARKRFSEIGGVNPRLVAAVVAALPRFHWLYLRRSDQTMCCIGP